RMFHWKGHLLLVEALGRVRQAMPDFRLVVVGADDERGAPGRGSLTAEVKALAARHGLGEQIVYAGWRSDVERLLAESAVDALPSFEEPLGIVYLEARAMEQPVL